MISHGPVRTTYRPPIASFDLNRAPSGLKMAPFGLDKALYGPYGTIMAPFRPPMVVYGPLWAPYCARGNVDGPYGNRNPLLQYIMPI